MPHRQFRPFAVAVVILFLVSNSHTVLSTDDIHTTDTSLLAVGAPITKPVHSVDLKLLLRSCTTDWGRCSLSQEVGDTSRYLNLQHYLIDLSINNTVVKDLIVDTGISWTIVFPCVTTQVARDSPQAWRGPCYPEAFKRSTLECERIIVTESSQHSLPCFGGYENQTLYGAVNQPFETIWAKTDTLDPARSSLSPFWNNSAGSLGLAYTNGGTSFFTTLVSQLAREQGGSPYFGLNLNRDSGTSQLHIGGLEPPPDAGPIVWSEVQPFRPKTAHYFTLFELEVCGASLLSNYSGHWLAQVDTASTCLNLPADFVEMLRVWSPGSYCVPEPGSDDNPNTMIRTCYFPHKTDSDKPRPALSFRLRQGGPKLEIPLGGLCVHQGSPDGRTRASDSMPFVSPSGLIRRQILLGTDTLRYLYTAFDTENGRIGFAQKPTPDTSDALCPPRPICEGAQTYYRPLNLCLDPTCERYYFHTVNTTTKQCQLTITFEVIVLILLIIFSCTELFLNELYQRLMQAASNTLGSTNNRPAA